MLFNALWNCLTGYVMIKVEGLSLERFLNFAVENKVRIWEARREKYTLLTAYVSAAGYRKLLKLNEDRYFIYAVKKRGLPFLLLDAKRRFALASGLMLIVSAVLALSCFVWQIRLQGFEKMDPAVIRNEVKNTGIHEGTWKGQVDLKALENGIIRKYPQIAWVNAEFEGVVLKIQVVEAKIPPEIIDTNGAADIVAKKDAFIKKIIVMEGKPAVKEGQTVRKGQTLIDGEILEEGKPRMSFHARGKVTGAVWYKGQGETRLYTVIKTPTGKTADFRYIQIGNNLVLMGGQEPGFKSTIDTVKVAYAIGENLFFPVKILNVRMTEVVEQRLMRPITEAKAEAEEKAYRNAMSQMPDDMEIMDLNFTVEIHEDIVQAICYIETEEEIGITVKTDE